jgi:3-hexulose-6-phosphate synthase
MKMKLQLALDDITLAGALELLQKVHEFIDIVEVGTPFILAEGMAPVREIKQRVPALKVLADTKIMDAGELEAKSAFAAGADLITVLGVTDILTVKACLKAAEPYGGSVVIDMICVSNLEEKVRQLEDAGVTCLAVHAGVDQQAEGRTPLDDLKSMRTYSNRSVIFVAGGINLSTIKEYKKNGADVAIIGGGICNAADPVQEARAIAEKIRQSK